MSKLDDFLGLVDVSEVRKTITMEFDDKTFEFVIRPLTEAEHNEFQRRCNNIIKNKMSFDSGKYNNLILDACIVEPNFKDAEFLSKVGCVTATDFLTRKFPAGILTEIGVQIQKLSGFDSYEVEIENAKN